MPNTEDTIRQEVEKCFHILRKSKGIAYPNLFNNLEALSVQALEDLRNLLCHLEPSINRDAINESNARYEAYTLDDSDSDTPRGGFVANSPMEAAEFAESLGLTFDSLTFRGHFTDPREAARYIMEECGAVDVTGPF